LKIGNIVKAIFLGSPEICDVVDIVEANVYNLRILASGTILPNAKWKRDKDKKTPWYIEEYISDSKN